MTELKERKDPRKRFTDIDASLWAELLFTFLPFLIIFVVLAFKGSISRLIVLPEWAFAAAILSGQAMVKFVSGLLEYKKDLNMGMVALIISALIVILLAPSLVILSLILAADSPTLGLGIAQIILFLFSVLAFLNLGKVGKTIEVS